MLLESTMKIPSSYQWRMEYMYFHCEVDAYPEAIISWSLSGRGLFGNTQFVTIDNQTLMIHPPLSNGIGGEEVTCNVRQFSRE